VAFSVLALALAAGCGGDGKSADPSPAPTREDALLCGRRAGGAETISYLDSTGERIRGALVGRGRVGFLFAHAFREDLCSWLPFARHVADGGDAALTFTFPGGVPDADDVAAGVTQLRRHGARDVVLVGASMGAAASLVAANRVHPLVRGVVSVSSPLRYSGLDAIDAARRLRVPVVYTAGRDDGHFAAYARRLFLTTHEDTKRLVILDDFAHGTDLLGGPEGERFARVTVGLGHQHGG